MFSAGSWSPAVGLTKLVSPFSLTRSFSFFCPLLLVGMIFVRRPWLVLILFEIAAFDLMEGGLDGMPFHP